MTLALRGGAAAPGEHRLSLSDTHWTCGSARLFNSYGRNVDPRACIRDVRLLMCAQSTMVTSTRVKRKRRVRVPKGMLPFKLRGGARPGAGRKPKGERKGVSHRQRAALAARLPVHVTVKTAHGLPRLRRARE